mgnify:CR=1 FL=1
MSVKVSVTSLKNRLILNNLGEEFIGFLLILGKKCNIHIIPNQALYRAEPHPEKMKKQ